MACWMYEGVLMFGVVFISGYLFSALTQTRHALDNRGMQQAFLFVVFGIYFVWFWAKGQTLAMKTWHIRITDVQGQSISQWRALARYALSYLWFLPPLVIAALFGFKSSLHLSVLMVGWLFFYALLSRLHKEGQFLHDALAGTRLVHVEKL
jgi:uncharacterized RDD family membrane protein YckC